MSEKGPDRVVPAEKFATTEIEEPVKLRIPTTGKITDSERRIPISIPTLIQNTVRDYGNKPALGYKNEEDTWQTMSYRDFLENIMSCAKFFIDLKLERHRGVCILGYNSPQWVIANLGTIFAGGVASGIYPTSTPEACLHYLNTSKAQICVVEDDTQAEKILEIKNQTTHLKTVIQIDGSVKEGSEILTWDQVMKRGATIADVVVENVLETIAINECCTLVFTSGTTGPPKAAMLSHDNLISNALTVSNPFSYDIGVEKIVSYLPLSHAAAQIMDIYVTISKAACTYFAGKDALRGTLVNTLRQVRPTIFFAVPRIFEKIKERMESEQASKFFCKRKLLEWATMQGLNHYLNPSRRPHSESWSFWLAKNRVLCHIKQKLGLDQCKKLGSSGAPLVASVKTFFLSIDLPIIDGYGMTETSGGHICNHRHIFDVQTVGKTMSGFKTKILRPDRNGQGEILAYGRHVFMGYLGDEAGTVEAIDDEGWLHTGDVGMMNHDGFVYLTGRSKEILITSGGENVAPLVIEKSLKELCPGLFSTVVLIGEGRKYLTVMFVLRAVADTSTGIPQDELSPEAKNYLKDSLGCVSTTISQFLSKGPEEKILDHLKECILKVNSRAFATPQKVQRFVILDRDFSLVTGEYGPTMKLKRDFVMEKYKKLVDILYSEDPDILKNPPEPWSKCRFGIVHPRPVSERKASTKKGHELEPSTTTKEAEETKGEIIVDEKGVIRTYKNVHEIAVKSKHLEDSPSGAKIYTESSQSSHTPRSSKTLTLDDIQEVQEPPESTENSPENDDESAGGGQVEGGVEVHQVPEKFIIEPEDDPGNNVEIPGEQEKNVISQEIAEEAVEVKQDIEKSVVLQLDSGQKLEMPQEVEKPVSGPSAGGQVEGGVEVHQVPEKSVVPEGDPGNNLEIAGKQEKNVIPQEIPEEAVEVKQDIEKSVVLQQDSGNELEMPQEMEKPVSQQVSGPSGDHKKSEHELPPEAIKDENEKEQPQN